MTVWAESTERCFPVVMGMAAHGKGSGFPLRLRMTGGRWAVRMREVGAGQSANVATTSLNCWITLSRPSMDSSPPLRVSTTR